MWCHKKKPSPPRVSARGASSGSRRGSDSSSNGATKIARRAGGTPRDPMGSVALAGGLGRRRGVGEALGLVAGGEGVGLLLQRGGLALDGLEALLLGALLDLLIDLCGRLGVGGLALAGRLGGLALAVLARLLGLLLALLGRLGGLRAALLGGLLALGELLLGALVDLLGRLAQALGARALVGGGVAQRRVLLE